MRHTMILLNAAFHAVSHIIYVAALCYKRDGAVVVALRYKPEGHGIGKRKSRWCRWNFYCHNPSGRTKSLGLTQPLTEMSARDISWE
jgi:hypothetical protein